MASSQPRVEGRDERARAQTEPRQRAGTDGIAQKQQQQQRQRRQQQQMPKQRQQR